MTAPAGSPDLILRRGCFATLDRSNSVASAVAIKEAASQVMAQSGHA